MKKYNAYYIKEIITNNTQIRSDEFSCISFENIGTDNAKIDGIIPLENTGIAREFSEKPYVKIDVDFMITFDNASTDKQVLVIKTVYKEINV